MKTKLILIAIALALPIKAQQQYMANQEPQDHSNAVGGAVAGAVVGGIVGNQLHHNTAAGVIVGGLAGALIGNAIDQQPQYQQPSRPVIVVQPQPPMPPAPLPVDVYTRYTYGPLDSYGYPQWVYIWTWNGQDWVANYYPYQQFTVWYSHTYHRPYRCEDHRRDYRPYQHR